MFFFLLRFAGRDGGRAWVQLGYMRQRLSA